MNCKRAQAQIALSVGGDLDDAAELELGEHLESCTCCKRHRQQMTDTWELLLEREDEPSDPHDSVWPDLQVRLPDRREFLSRARFNGGVVALAVAAVLLAMVSVWRTANTSEPLLSDPAGMVDVDPSGAGPSPFLEPRRPSPGFLPVGGSYRMLPGERESVSPPLRFEDLPWGPRERRPALEPGPPF